jgi:hypothetical protein
MCGEFGWTAQADANFFIFRLDWGEPSISPPEPNDCPRLFDPQHHFLGYTKKERRILGHLKELQMHVSGKDELDWCTPQGDYHASANRERARS